MERAVLETGMDRYVIVEHLAEGGMGAIYRGKKVGVGGSEKEVVLKQLLPEFTAHDEFIGLFLREAKLSATLDHINIVRTLDLVASGNDYFIVMEYICGGDLRGVLRKVRRRHLRLSPAACIFITREMLSALNYAHNSRSDAGQPLKLIHRDISPSNVMLSLAGEVKLADFGIAKVSTHKSVFYRVKGKAGYMSPEQAFGDRPIDHRSDLFSLGVCFYEMLAGERLFVADLISTPRQIYSQSVPKMESVPSMPQGIDLFLARILALDPDKRFQSALEFQEALLHIAYDNNLLYTAPDLAAELREKCGDSPAAWRSLETPVRNQPPTQIFTGTAAVDLGEVALTSVLDATVHERLAHPPAPETPPNPFHDDDATLPFAPPSGVGPDRAALAGGQIHEQETLLLLHSGDPMRPTPAIAAKKSREAHGAPGTLPAPRERAMLIAAALLLVAAAIILMLASLIGGG